MFKHHVGIFSSTRPGIHGIISHLNGSGLLFPKLGLREAAPSFCKLSPQPNVPDSLLSLSDKREHKEE